jgi:creatinine amidohydrolase
MDLIPLTTTADVAAQRPAVAVLPVGSFEQHGPALPLATDTIVATAIAGRLAAVYPVLVLPALPISCSHEHAAWPGTVSLSFTTVTAVIADITTGLAAQGISKLVIVNAHGGNYFLANVVQTANSVTPRSMALFPATRDWDRARNAAGMVTGGHEDMHGGELEVSILHAVAPHATRPGAGDFDHIANDRPMLLVDGMVPYTEHGVIGQPSAATAAKGEAVLDSLVTAFGGYLNALSVPQA